MNLSLANIMHNKFRSLISALGIGIAVCMLITLTGLARGSLFEIAERMESVDADLIVLPSGSSHRAPTHSRTQISEKYAELIEKKYPDLILRATPVFIATMKLAGQDQRATGLSPKDWDIMTGDRPITQGRLFDPDEKFARWIEKIKLNPDDTGDILDITAAHMSDPKHNGMEIVIDSRLARAGNYTVGQQVYTENHNWTIVGIVPAGVTTRVFMPIRTAQQLFNVGDITKCTFIFLKLGDLPDGLNASGVAEKIGQHFNLDVMPLDRYRGALQERFGMMLFYVDAVNVIALCIAFLFVMNTLYTMVVQRNREIAILKSCGASWWYIMRQILYESIILTATGSILGILGSLAAGWGIEQFRPLLTVIFTWQWILTAIIAAFAGATVAAIYPACRAAKVDMVEALTYE